jgi:hypothetical protein
MTEYGHTGYRIPGCGFVDQWGAGPYVVTAGGRVYYFEDSKRFGPCRLTAKGEVWNNGVGMFEEDSPFWPVWRRWVDEGRQTVEGRKGRLYCVVSRKGGSGLKKRVTK